MHKSSCLILRNNHTTELLSPFADERTEDQNGEVICLVSSLEPLFLTTKLCCLSLHLPQKLKSQTQGLSGGSGSYKQEEDKQVEKGCSISPELWLPAPNPTQPPAPYSLVEVTTLLARQQSAVGKSIALSQAAWVHIQIYHRLVTQPCDTGQVMYPLCTSVSSQGCDGE